MGIIRLLYQRGEHLLEDITTDNTVVLMIGGVEKSAMMHSVLPFFEDVVYKNLVLFEIERTGCDTLNDFQKTAPT